MTEENLQRVQIESPVHGPIVVAVLARVTAEHAAFCARTEDEIRALQQKLFAAGMQKRGREDDI